MARQRKQQQSSARVNNAAQRAVSEPEPAPRPVTVRNTTFGTPLRQRVATTNPRRQYYVALDAPGTEMRLPALPVIRFGARSVSLMLAAACLIGIFSIFLSPFFTVEAPMVSGLNRLTQAEIDAALDLNGTLVIGVDPQALKKTLLQQYPILESANITVSLPNQVSVTVKERQPIFSWTYADKTLWADGGGVLFPPAGEPVAMLTIKSDDAPPLLVTPEEIEAMQTAKQEAAKSLAKGEPVIPETLKKTADKTSPDTIDPSLLAAAQKLSTYFPGGMVLVYSKSHGLGWQDPGGWDVYIGRDLENFDQKYALYLAASNQLAGQSITPALISVEFMDWSYFRVEK